MTREAAESICALMGYRLLFINNKCYNEIFGLHGPPAGLSINYDTAYMECLDCLRFDEANGTKVIIPE